MLKIHGPALSPFVRKVLLTLEYKGIEYQNVLVFPGSDDPDFRAMSPLGKIPVLEHDGFTVPDSSVICRYLDRVFPERPIYPADPMLEARATWIEEYADTRLMDACGGLFFQRLMRPRFLNQPTDEEVVGNILDNLMPAAARYAESIIPDSGGPLVGDAISIADISIVTCFCQARYGEFEVDGNEFPRLRAYLDGALSNEIVKARLESEKRLLAA